MKEDASESIVIVRHADEPFNVTVSGLWDDILVDRGCKSIKKGSLMYKAETEETWTVLSLDVDDDSFVVPLLITDLCAEYSLMLSITGYIDDWMDQSKIISYKGLEEVSLDSYQFSRYGYLFFLGVCTLKAKVL